MERKDTLTASLKRDYLERKAQIRTDSSLSWEKQEKATKALGDDYRTRRRELEREKAA